MDKITINTTTSNVIVFKKKVTFKTRFISRPLQQVDSDIRKIRNALSRVKFDYDLAFKKLAKE